MYSKQLLSKLLVPGILFSTSPIFVFKTVAVIKPLARGIFLSTSLFFLSKFCLSVLYWFMWIKAVPSGIFLSKLFTFVFSVEFVFLITSLSTTSLYVFKPTGTVFNLPTSKSPTFVFKLFKLVETSVSWFMSSLLTSAFKVRKNFLTTQSDASMPVSCSSYFLVAQFGKSNTTLTLSLMWLSGPG